LAERIAVLRFCSFHASLEIFQQLMLLFQLSMSSCVAGFVFLGEMTTQTAHGLFLSLPKTNNWINTKFNVSA